MRFCPVLRLVRNSEFYSIYATLFVEKTITTEQKRYTTIMCLLLVTLTKGYENLPAGQNSNVDLLVLVVVICWY